MWKQVGIKTELSNSEVAVHFENMRNGDYEVGRAGWVADYPDAQNFLFLLEWPNPTNYNGWNNKTYNDLMAKAAKTVDLKKRAKIMHKAEQLMLDDFATLPLYYYVSKNIVSTKVKGWETNAENIHRTRWMSK